MIGFVGDGPRAVPEIANITLTKYSVLTKIPDDSRPAERNVSFGTTNCLMKENIPRTCENKSRAGL